MYSLLQLFASSMEKWRLRSRNPRLIAMGICCTDHATPSICKKLALTSPTSGGHSVGIVRLRTKSHGVYFFSCFRIFGVLLLKNKSTAYTYIYIHYLYECSTLLQQVCILAKLVKSHTLSRTLCILTLSVWIVINTFLEKI
jgi:hypothetical protein